MPYLLARGEVRLDDAAAHFGTDADQIERDLRLLFMTGVSPGLPGDLIEVDLEALEGDRIIRVDNADYLARPVRFSPAEATSLVVALRTMVDAAPAEAREVIERTLAKLEEAAGQDGEGLLRLHVTPTPLESSAVVPVLESALAHGHQAEITYHVPSRDRGVPPRRRSPRAGPGRGPALPRRLVPHRRGRPRLPGRPHRGRHGARQPRRRPGRPRPRPHRRLVHRRRDHAPSPCAWHPRRAGSSSTTR